MGWEWCGICEQVVSVCKTLSDALLHCLHGLGCLACWQGLPNGLKWHAKHHHDDYMFTFG
jgi:hypothetical protein